MKRAHDVVLVGLGLQNALVALALAARRPGTRVAIVESASVPFGSHTWCFHAGDVPDEAAPFVEPAVEVRWPRYEVRFPGYTRTLAEPYAAVTSPSLARAVSAACAQLEVEVFLGRTAREVTAREVTLDDGQVVRGELVIDARGPEDLRDVAGYQKFVGLEVALAEPCAFIPRVMDAQVAQHDGFRFMYALPFAPERVLLEDTYYARTAELDVSALEARIHTYAAAHGMAIARVIRRESGVLPLPRAPALPPADGALSAGYRGGFFHPVTGYSFPLAVRLAWLVACTPREALPHQVAQLRRRVHAQARYLCMLNRLLFGAMPDAQRRNVLERFYLLPEGLVRRFYALELGALDRARIVCGRPPRGLSLRQALHTTRSA